MRTDVKVGLICAFAIVLCVVIYFVARGNKRPLPMADSGGGTSTLLSSLPEPTPAGVAASSGGGVGGGVIGLPGSATPASSGFGAAPTAGPTVMSSTATPPGMGPTMAISGTGTPTGTSGLPMSGFGTSSATPPTGGTFAPSGTPSILGSWHTPSGSPTGSAIAGLPGSTGTSSLALSTGATTHKIQQGDTLNTIARKYNVTVKALAAANPGIDPTRLKINNILKVPAPAPVATTPPGTATPATPRTVTASPTGVHTAVASATVKPGTTYKVKKGDTLTTIAKAAYGASSGGVRKIFQANRTELTDPNVVPVGTSIVIPQ